MRKTIVPPGYALRYLPQPTFVCACCAVVSNCRFWCQSQLILHYESDPLLQSFVGSPYPPLPLQTPPPPCNLPPSTRETVTSMFF